jgi:hypothetical protein
MNTETGRIYDNATDILAARLRGEPVVPVSQKVADTMRAGQFAMNRAERRAEARLNRKLKISSKGGKKI